MGRAGHERQDHHVQFQGATQNTLLQRPPMNRGGCRVEPTPRRANEAKRGSLLAQDCHNVGGSIAGAVLGDSSGGIMEIRRPAREVLVGFATRPLNVAANLTAIIGLVAAVVAQIGWDSQAIPLLYICGLSLFLLLRYVRQERWSRYAEGVQVMDRAHRRLKEATDTALFGDSGESARVLVLERLQQSLSAFAEAFTLVTGTNCRASIKEVYVEELPKAVSRSAIIEFEKELFVATIVRSDADASAQVTGESPDRVSENTDFARVLSSIKPYHEGDLPREWLSRRYENSHWGDELRQSKEFLYRSTIVWPVENHRPRTSREGDTEGEEPVIAVLCVDSRKRHAFRPRADLQFGSLYAHALYTVLRFDRS